MSRLIQTTFRVCVNNASVTVEKETFYRAYNGDTRQDDFVTVARFTGSEINLENIKQYAKKLAQLYRQYENATVPLTIELLWDNGHTILAEIP